MIWSCLPVSLFPNIISGQMSIADWSEAAKKMGYTQSWFEKALSNNPRTKKWFKMLVQIRGMKKLEKSVLPNNYLSLWTAGKSAELVHDIISCEEIVTRIKKEYQNSIREVSAINISSLSS